MWSHYSENHRGFVVGIDHRRLGDIPLFPVSYTDRRVLYKTTTPFRVRPPIRTLDMFLRKSSQWSYEREFRSIWPIDQLLPGRIGDAAAYFLPLLPEAIVEVRLGCRASPELEAAILKALRQIGSGAKVTRATLHPRLYRLSFETRGKKEAATSSGS